MPGVLKISPGGSPGPGMSYQAHGGKAGSHTKMTPRSPNKPSLPAGDFGGDLAEKVARLEKHLDALYQLPGNQELLDKARQDGMSVNDMWQIIQLNNRIAAAEAAIQKMASLIEDLAKNMNRVKGDTKHLKKGADDIAATNSDLAIQSKIFADSHDKVRDVINGLKDEINDLKKGLKNDRDLLEKTLGVDLGRVPSFLKAKPDRDPYRGAGEDPSQQFERGTQTFVHLKDKEKEKELKPTSRPKPHPQEKDHEAATQKSSRAPEQQVGIGPDGKPYKPVRGADGKVSPSEMAKMSPEEILKTITPEEAAKMTPEIYKKMTPEQRQAVKDLRKSLQRAKKDNEREPMGVASMTAADVAKLDPTDITEKMTFDEAMNLPPDVLEKMDDKQKEAIENVLKKGPSKTKHRKKKEAAKPLGIASMPENRLADLKPADIAGKMPFEEAANIPPEVLDRLTEEQKNAIRKIVEAGPPQQPPNLDAYDDDDDDELDDPLDAYVSPKRGSLEPPEPKQKKKKKKAPQPLTTEQIQDISQLQPEDIASQITAEMAAAIPPEQMKQFTADQVKEIEKLKKQASMAEPTVDLANATASTLQEMTPSDLVGGLTGDQLQELTQEQLDKLSPEQKEAVEEAKRKSMEDEGEEEEYEGDESEAETVSGAPKKERQKPAPHRHRGKDKHHHSKHHHHHHPDGLDGAERSRSHHAHVDIVAGPIPTVGEPLPPMSLEKYLATLPPEEAANLAADAVQRELQKQYAHLQGMQRQLAQDIQEKMEYIYQKLLKEIAAQQLTTSPYMSVGQDICMGPGVCTGHGMPAGIAVCQFPEASKNMQGPTATGAVMPYVPEGSVCPGPGVCPGSAVCPHCQGLGKFGGEAGQPGTGLQALRAPGERKPGEAAGPATTGATMVSELDEALLKEMKSLMLLDLEKIREDMRSKKFGAFDEQDIVERLGAVWEALKILKHNEEAIAVKIARQDAMMKKLPTKMIDKLNKIPEENLEAIASGQFQKPMYFPEGTAPERHSVMKDHADAPKPALRGTLTPADKEDIQTLYNNLANVISECTELKDRIDQLADTARIMEAGMVTKQMLLDALSDKADKGLINTKVSYDEFGNTVDELHTQLHNLMVEGYQRNENWKKVTSELAEELAEKLDKVELAPIRAFFKSHLKALEDKVKNLSDLIDEPDPAGTRKRLLRDYNCISCDRMVNITGVTNGPTLPTVGPIRAGHPTASRRALDLHRMRMLKQLDPNLKNALERQAKKGQKSGKKPSNLADPAQLANDIDVMHVVNRYTGGSHTNVSTADRIASQRRPSNGSNQPQTGPTTTSRTASNQNIAAAPAAAATSSPKGSRAGSLTNPPPRVSIGGEHGGEDEANLMNEMSGEGSNHEMYEEEMEMERVPSVPLLDPVMSGGNLVMYPMGIEE
ncbi:unnamed protein product [Orchesella dallaii]